MSIRGEPDEATTRDHWRARPMIGDIIEATDGLPRQGRVVDTFYGNGEGGMHVAFDHGCSWASCHRFRVVTRWYMLLDTSEKS